jgi:DNA-binding response OmpR family regulator
MSQPANTNAGIFLIEDDTDQADLYSTLLTGMAEGVPVEHFARAETALEVLLERAQSGHLLPRLVLLDINMPGMSGLQLLGELRSRAALDLVPVVVFSSSTRPADIVAAAHAGASAFVEKPHGFAKLEKVLKATLEFWLHFNRLNGEQMRVVS